MSSRIEQIIDELEDYITGCKNKLFSQTEIIVNRDEIEEFIRELRMKTPEEIKRYQKIINNKEAILNDAREKAAKLISDATVQTNELISEHEIMQQAYAQARDVVSLATQQAQDILDKAVMEANELRGQAAQYTEDRLAEIEAILVNSLQHANADYESLIGHLTQYRDVIQANRRALYPNVDYENMTESEDASQSEE